MTRMTSIKRIIICLIVTLFTLPAFCGKTYFNSLKPSVYMDLPEGFGVKETGENGRYYMLSSSILPVTAIIRIYPQGRFNSNKEALDDVMSKFSLSAQTGEFEWGQCLSAISIFEGNMLGIQSSGFAASTSLPDNQGTFLYMIWSSSENFEDCAAFMGSFMDSLYLSPDNSLECGAMTAFAYPKESEKEEITVNIEGTEVKSWINPVDVEAADYLVKREYNTLLNYQKSPVWQLAWQRYYRMIYRDSCSRLLQFTYDAYKSLAPNCEDNTDLATKLLNWTQNFEYTRESRESDFVSLPAAVCGEGCDCDTRSMLLCVMLNGMNMNSCLFVSASYGHAIAGLVSEHPGFAFTLGEKAYLTGETTAKGLSWGKIASDMTDQSQWIPVLFY
ncbi:hypothetical protein [Treponema sp.]|uniref:hypothetical protein n=1 Tax=Treponema sp. TaxID=166 RepID=UPI0025E5C868|nr:hypothetical protein [Treponema sp.]MCR5219309.1 hypothetical protein [Treponema sp.]